jgi:hypothetical protein
VHKFNWAPEPWQKALAEKHSLTCPDGWYGFACGEGWKKLLDEAFTAMKALGWRGEIHQVKEKFGGLRLYCEQDGDERLFDIIRKAEDESYRIRTLCDECRAKSEKALEARRMREAP